MTEPIPKICVLLYKMKTLTMTCQNSCHLHYQLINASD